MLISFASAVDIGTYGLHHECLFRCLLDWEISFSGMLSGGFSGSEASVEALSIGDPSPAFFLGLIGSLRIVVGILDDDWELMVVTFVGSTSNLIRGQEAQDK